MREREDEVSIQSKRGGGAFVNITKIELGEITYSNG